MIVIMVSGKAGSGKDTFFKLAEKFCECKRFAIGDAMKEIASVLFSWDGDKTGDKRWLLIDIANILRGNYEGVDKEDFPERKLYKFSYLYGVLKTLYNPYKNFWVDIVLNKLKENKPDIAIITDWRLISEYDSMVKRFSRQDVITVRVEREVKKINDKTETELDNFDFDYEIINDGSIEDYEDKILELIKELKL